MMLRQTRCFGFLPEYVFADWIHFKLDQRMRRALRAFSIVAQEARVRFRVSPNFDGIV